MTEIFGDFIEGLPESPEYLIIGFSPSSVPLKQRWRNNGLSADFLGDYLATFFPSEQDDSETRNRKRAELKSTVSYIANELLENAMKFNYEKSPLPISIRLQLESDKLLFSITNSVNPQNVNEFKDYLKKIITGNPEELYISQLEAQALDETDKSSRLGYLTIMNDYMAKIGWKFETIQKSPEVITVTTMVHLAI